MDISLRDRIFVMPRSAGLLLAAAAGSLGLAFVAQYGFGLKPCILCLWQRVPFGVVIALSAFALYVRHDSNTVRILLMLCAVAFFADTGLALFHSGVERHWWMGTSGCGIQPMKPMSLEEMRQSLLSTDVVRCDQISWKFLGLSMTNWNVFWSLLLMVFSGLAARRT